MDPVPRLPKGRKGEEEAAAAAAAAAPEEDHPTSECLYASGVARRSCRLTAPFSLFF